MKRVSTRTFISPTHKRTEGRAPCGALMFTSKRRRTTGGVGKTAATLNVKLRDLPGGGGGAQAIVRGGARCAPQIPHRFAQAVSRGASRCASQVLDRGEHADARGATHVLDRGVQAVSRGAARCALHVHGRGARTDYAAVVSRCCRRRLQQLVCACGS